MTWAGEAPGFLQPRGECAPECVIGDALGDRWELLLGAPLVGGFNRRPKYVPKNVRAVALRAPPGQKDQGVRVDRGQPGKGESRHQSAMLSRRLQLVADLVRLGALLPCLVGVVDRAHLLRSGNRVIGRRGWRCGGAPMAAGAPTPADIRAAMIGASARLRCAWRRPADEGLG